MSKKNNNILKKGMLTVNGSLWLEMNGQKFFGPGPVELLQYIEETGSIRQAAVKMQMSYKKAWEIVNNLNAVMKHPIVITATGGEKGGGSSVSEDAKQLIIAYRQLRERFNNFLEKESGRIS
ncbi:MAG: LysR family transcriptional regulator [Chitinophagaceae bacterium]